ncbi:MAG: ribosome maturation factor [Micavibrio sp.]|nr:ribosome maturation factor [Micavibrio sp.]|tara:strand:+ start:1182 stop:1712 length:531 start_codon:yes stop_codon:yes gene_type:complete
MKQSTLENRISQIIRPAIEDMGYRLVTVQMGQDGSMALVQVMAENPDTGLISLDACASISREISALLDVEDPLDHAYRLEVSSPGIDRMLFTTEDFSNYLDQDVKIELSMPMENDQKKLRGKIKSVEGNDITVVSDGQEFVIDIDAMSKAKLVLTDDLLKHAKAKKEAADAKSLKD